MVFLTRFGSVFGDAPPGLRRRQQCDAARLPELQGCGCILVDERRLDRGFLRAVLAEHAREAPRWMATSGAATSSRSLVSTQPHATKISRLPATSTTPQPVRRSPGRSPECEISGALMA